MLFASLFNEVGNFDVCVVFFFSKHKTRLFACLDLVFWFLSACVCFHVLYFWYFCFSFQARNRQTPPPRNAETNVYSVSAAVFTNCVPKCLGVGFKNALVCLLQHYKNSGFSKKSNNKWPTILQKVESVSGPRLGQYLVQACCATLTQLLGRFKTSFWQVALKILSTCRKKNICKKQNKETKLGPDVDKTFAKVLCVFRGILRTMAFS